MQLLKNFKLTKQFFRCFSKNNIISSNNIFNNFNLSNHFTSLKTKISNETDILIVGGGLQGLMVAFWFKQYHPTGYEIMVVEKDFTYSNSSSQLYLEGIHFSHFLEEYVLLSQETSLFLRNLKSNLAVPGLEEPDVMFHPESCLRISNKRNLIEMSHKFHKKFGIESDLLNKDELKQLFPWIQVDDCGENVMATYGQGGEGWYDVGLLLAALKIKGASLGVKFVSGEVVGFMDEKNNQFVAETNSINQISRLKVAKIKTENNEIFDTKFAICISCASYFSAPLAKLAGIGNSESGPNSIPLPINPRPKHVFLLSSPETPPLQMPMLMDQTGLFLRKYDLHGKYMCTILGDEGEKPLKKDNNLEIKKYFDRKIRPLIIQRIPSLHNSNLLDSWHGYVDENIFDFNLILSNHPYHKNFFMVAGGSPSFMAGIGKGLLELIIKSEFKSIDLKKFIFDRVMQKKPLPHLRERY